MKYLLVTLLFLCSLVYGNENGFTNEESSVFGTPVTGNVTKDIKTIEEVSRYQGAKNLYLSYLSYPKHIYKNQRFEIEVKALITRTNFDSIKTSFVNGKNMLPLNENQFWKRESTDVYINKFYFKAYEKDFKMPDIQVALYSGEDLVEVRILKSEELTFSEIARGDDTFSQIIAKDLKVITSKTKQYTNKQALTILDIQANKSNLEDFNLKGFEDQGITLIEDNYPKQNIIYYLVIPIHKKSITFNYYNTTSNKFEKIIVPITLDEELVSTQTDLNPSNSNFEFYKKIAVGVLLFLFVVLFIWKRNYLFLIAALVVTIAFILFVIPNKTITIKANSMIYILPTKNSTIFKKVKQNVVVEQMKEKADFVKIMIGNEENKFIGWVKKDDIIKN